MRWLQHLTGGALGAIAAAGAAFTAAVAPHPAVVAATLVSCGAAGYVLVAAVYRPRPIRPSPIRPAALLPVAAVPALAACAAAQALGADLWPWVIPPALVTAAALTGTGWPRPPVAALGAGLTGIVTAAATGNWWTGATAAVAATVSVAGVLAQVWVWEVADAADRARRADAAAAVAAERDRFAAELHDIQGHSLQVIAFKSELAARLAATEPARAAAEMREVETLARSALADTRDLVHGYRPVALESEIANAVRVLASAGVPCRTSLAPVPPHAERLFALVVREATTNVLRHSAATGADLAVQAGPAGLRLTVRNDAPLPPPGPAGGGLAGLERRFAAVGGTVTWSLADGCFQVTADLPAEPTAASSATSSAASSAAAPAPSWVERA